MMLEEESFDRNDFMSMFKKRFYSFCDKSPLFIKCKITDVGITIYDYSEDVDENIKSHYFDFDFSHDEKYNIKTIKNFLVENWYPIINVEKVFYKKPDPIEINEIMVKDKCSFTEATTNFIKSYKKKTFRLEKVLNESNSVIVRDFDDNNLYLYKSRMPVSIFMKQLFSDKEEAFKNFSNKFEMEKQVLDKKE